MPLVDYQKNLEKIHYKSSNVSSNVPKKKIQSHNDAKMNFLKSKCCMLLFNVDLMVINFLVFF